MNSNEKREVAIYLRLVNKIGDGLRAAENDLRGFSERSLGMMQSYSRRAGIALLAFATASVLVGAQFEQAMANVSSVAGATGEEMDRLSDRARQLGATTAFTATQAGGAMYALASSGMKTNEIIAASEGVLKLAGATMSDMTTSAEITVATLKQFELQATDTNRVVNVFGAGIRNSMLNMSRLVDSMHYVGPMAHSVGMSLEETTAALAGLHNGGLMASMAGTGLRMVLSTLLQPNDDLSRAMNGVTLATHGFRAVIEQLQSQSLSADKLSRMFDVRALNAAMILLGQGVDEFDRLTEAVTGTNSAFEMYDMQMNTVYGQFKILRSAIEESLIASFDAMKPALREALVQMIQFIEDSRAGLKQVSEQVGGVTLAIAKMFNGLQGSGNVVPTFTSQLAGAAAGLLGVSVAVSAAMKLRGLVAVITATTGPIGALVAALAVLAAAFVGGVQAQGGFDKWMKWIGASVQINIERVKHFMAANNAMSLAGQAQFRGQTSAAAKYRAELERINAEWEKREQYLNNWESREGQTAGVYYADTKPTISEGDAEFLGFDGPPGAGQEALETQAEAIRLASELASVWRDVEAATGAAALAVDALRDRTPAEQDAGAKEYLQKPIDQWGRPQNMTYPQWDETEPIWFDSRAELDEFNESIAFGIQLTEEAHGATRDLSSGWDVATRRAFSLKEAGRQAMETIGSSARAAAEMLADSFATAIVNSKEKLIDLASIGRSVFGMLLSYGIRFGIAMIPGSPAWVQAAMGFAGKAAGGPVSSGVPYMVGERGPELFMPSSNGTIVPNHQLGDFVSGGNAASNESKTFNVAVQITPGSLIIADDSMAITRFAKKLHRELTRIDGKLVEA